MNYNNIDINDLRTRMLFVKIGTLVSHLPKNEVKKYYECSYEFDVDSKTNIPIKLHVWLGKNHNYQTKYHREFDVPDFLKTPLI